MRLLISALLLGLLALLPARAQTTVAGQLTAADGTPLPAGHVAGYVVGERAPMWVVPVGPDGAYTVDVDTTGFVRLDFSGALHRPHEVYLLLEGDDEVALDVRLGRAWLDPDQQYTRVIGSHNAFDYGSGTSVEAVAEHTYAATVPVATDTLSFELPGMTTQTFGELLLTDLTADAFTYRPDGTYRPAVAAPGDEVTVRYRAEPAETPEAATVTFGPDDARHDAFARFYARAATRPDLVINTPNGQRRVMRTPTGWEVLDEDDPSPMLQEVAALRDTLARQEDSYARGLDLLLYVTRVSEGQLFRYRRFLDRAPFQMGEPLPVDTALVREVFATIAPTSPVWLSAPVLIQTAVDLAGRSPEAEAYVATVIEEHPHPVVREAALYNLFYRRFGDEGLTDATRALAEQYRQTFPSGDQLEAVEALTAREPLKEGRRAPAVRSAEPLYGEATQLNWSELRNKVVLIDFWRPGTSAEAQDLATLEAVQERYGGRGVVIVRLALTDDVETARAEAPERGDGWIEARLPNGFHGELAQAYRLTTVPQRALIGADGVLVATDGLYGEALLDVLGGMMP